MADKKPIKATYSGTDTNGLAEFVAADTIGVADGGTGLTTVATSNLLTGNGASALSAEANLTFDGSTLAVTGAMTLSSTSTISGDMTFVDNAKVTLGTGGDADLYYDGTNVILTPDVVGSGYVSLDGDARVTGGHVFDVGTPPSNRSSTIASGNVTINGAVDGEFVALTLRNSQAQDTGTNETVKLNLSWADGGGDTAAGSAIIAGKEGTYASAATADSYLAFSTTLNNTPTERMRIDSAGRIGVGCDAPTTYGAVNSVSHSIVIGDTSSGNGNLTIANSTSGNGRIAFTDTADTTNQAYIRYNHSNNDMDFYVNGAERMRIINDGTVLIGYSSGSWADSYGTTIYAAGSAILHANGGPAIILRRATSYGDIMQFSHSVGGGTYVGSISVAASSTAYNTSSDYRLKENVVDLTGATTRVAQLQPHRFNFIRDPDTTVDGFVAHEVADIVPEAITGTKDEMRDVENVIVDADGAILEEGKTEAEWVAGKEPTLVSEATDEEEAVYADPIYAADTAWHSTLTVPEYQGIDQSKLVPLLTAAIQELTARVTALESA